MKTCTKCGETKPLEMFYRNKNTKDGLNSGCKLCRDAGTRAWREANPEKVSAGAITRSREYRKVNPEKVAAALKAWRKANPERVKALEKAWRKANPERVKALEKAWCKANPEKVKAASDRYRKVNQEKVGVRARAQAKVRCEMLTPLYVARTLGTSIRDAPPELLKVKAAHLQLLREVKRKLDNEER